MGDGPVRPLRRHHGDYLADVLMHSSSHAIPVSSLSSKEIDNALSFELWRDSVSSLFDCKLDRSISAADFHVNVTAYHLNQLLFGYTQASPQTFHRGRNHHPTDHEEHILIQGYTQAGFSGNYASYPISVKPGDINLLDLHYGLETHTKGGPFACFSLFIPRALLLPRLDTPIDLKRYAVLPRHAITVQLLHHYLRHTHNALATATQSEIPELLEALLGVLAGTINSQRFRSTEPTQSLDQQAFQLIRDFIDCHLQDPELTPDRLCTYFRCSRSYLYRLFKKESGVKQYIQQRRLEYCWAELARNGVRVQNISQIAYYWGFNNHSHFTRLFRRRFGETPSDVIERHFSTQTHLPGQSERDCSLTQPPPSGTYGDDLTPQYKTWFWQIR